MPVIIRTARDADAEAVLALAKAFATSFVVDDQAFSRAFAGLLTSADAHTAVAEIDRQLVGYMLLTPT